MQNLHIRSVVLGIGMGIILTSLMGIVYSAGMNNSMSREEIITEAKKYGMIEASSIIPASSATTVHVPGPGSSAVENTGAGMSDYSENNASDIYENNDIILTIDSEDTLETVIKKLEAIGLVSDGISFEERLRKTGLENCINTGTFKIKKGSDANEIINIITNPAH